MNEENMKRITDPKDIPSNLSDEEEIAFWENHSVTEEYLAKTEEVPEDERPRPGRGTRSVSVRFPDHTLVRLRKLADARGVGYQTLLKEFVTERLYEEEKRAGIMPLDSPKADAEHLD